MKNLPPNNENCNIFPQSAATRQQKDSGKEEPWPLPALPSRLPAPKRGKGLTARPQMQPTVIEYMQLTGGPAADKLTARANRAAKHAVLRRETGRFALQNGLFWRAKRHKSQHIEYQDVEGGAQN